MNRPFRTRMAAGAGAVTPFDPSHMPDEAILARIREMAERRSIPFALAFRLLEAKNAPTQVRNTLRTYTDVASYTPSILVEANPERISWLIFNSNTYGNVYFSYGPPIMFNPGGGSIPLGVQVPIGSFYQEANGTISMDDIYTWSDNPGNACAAYEGVLAVESPSNRV